LQNFIPFHWLEFSFCLIIISFVNILIAILDSLQLYPQRPSESIETILEQLGICFIKLVFHDVQVSDWESKKLALVFALNSKLPFQVVFSWVPLVNVKVIVFVEAPQNARDPSVLALIHLHVHQIHVARKDIPSCTFFVEVNAAKFSMDPWAQYPYLSSSDYNNYSELN